LKIYIPGVQFRYDELFIECFRRREEEFAKDIKKDEQLEILQINSKISLL
jgi:hypothetical protein